MTYTISREIGIDAGHRVPTHGSKCQNLHGHRYKIVAVCESTVLHESGEQKDMTLDFGFLKDVMVAEIDEPCDHGLILWWSDPLLETLFNDEDVYNSACDAVRRFGFNQPPSDHLVGGVGKLYIIPKIPTAEVLAKHWFYRLKPRVSARSDGLATLVQVKVHETPNCWAMYTEDPDASR